MRRVVGAAVSTIAGLIMLLSFKTQPTPTTVAAGPSAISDPNTTTTTSRATSTPNTSTTAATSGRTVTVTGNAVQTRYGPVQVQVTLTTGQITAVEAIEYPMTNARDRQINARGIPVLDQEALDAQSAKLDTVSGATYTSIGYMTSLQSAIDKAS